MAFGFLKAPLSLLGKGVQAAVKAATGVDLGISKSGQPTVTSAAVPAAPAQPAKPAWVIPAAIAGAALLVVLALVFLLGGSSNRA